MYTNNRTTLPSYYLSQRPQASAAIMGSPAYPTIKGEAHFHQTPMGALLVIEVLGLPSGRGSCASPVFALHIHDGPSCSGNAQDPFANARTHYNPDNCPHPYHAGDLPPLFGAGGRAFLAVLTDRFTVREIIGRTLILHSARDDFTTQPAGDAGQKIACGVIVG